MKKNYDPSKLESVEMARKNISEDTCNNFIFISQSTINIATARGNIF